MSEGTITVTIYDGEQYDDDWPFDDDTKLVDVIEWFKAKLSEVPPECQASTICEIGSHTSWEDSSYADMKITYERPETAEERDARIAAEQRSEAAIKQRDLETLRQLKAKYGDI